MLDVKLVRKRHKSYPEIFRAINKNFLPKAGVTVLAEVQRECPRDLSDLANSYHYKVHLLDSSVSIGTNKEQAPPVEYGTRPHSAPISALEPWARRHDIPVGAVWQSIKKKGTKAQPHLRPALDKRRRFLVALWADTYAKVFRILGAG